MEQNPFSPPNANVENKSVAGETPFSQVTAIPKRPILLVIFIGLSLVYLISTIAIVAPSWVATAMAPQTPTVHATMLLCSLAIASLRGISLLAVWFWRRWGFYLYCACTAGAIALAVMFETWKTNPATWILSVCMLAFLYFVLRPVWKQLK